MLVSVCVCVCVVALRIVSTDIYLHFINTFIIVVVVVNEELCADSFSSSLFNDYE